MKAEIRSGVLISFAVFLWLLLEYYLGFHSRFIDYYPFFTWLFIIIPVIGIYLTVRWKRNRVNKGRISFSEAFTSGMVITGVMVVLIPLFTLLYVTVINSLFFETMIAHRRMMIDGLDISPEDKQGMLQNTVQFYTLSAYTIRSFMITLVVGLVLSLIIAATIRKDASREVQPTKAG